MPYNKKTPTSDAAAAASAAAASAVVQKTATSAVAPAQSNRSLLRSMIGNDEVKLQFRNALGKHADTFLASIIDLYNSDSNLMLCQPKQVVAEALKAATLRLPINKQLGFAYIIPFNNNKQNPDGSWSKRMEPTFQIGYKGYVQLAMRSGQYKRFQNGIVYEGELKATNKMTGEIDLSGTRTSDKVIGYFCYEELNNGFNKVLYMTVEEMAAHAKRYAKGIPFKTTVDDLLKLAQQPFDPNSKTVGWLGNFHSMGIKTVTRQLLSKWGCLSIEMNNALANDIKADSTLDPDNDPSNAIPTEDTDFVDLSTDEVVNVPAPTPQPAPGSNSCPFTPEEEAEILAAERAESELNFK